MGYVQSGGGDDLGARFKATTFVGTDPLDQRAIAEIA